MYKEKGLVKVFNGKKFKIVSYKNTKGKITFTTSKNSKKFTSINQSGKIIVLENGTEKTYNVAIFKNKITVDQEFKALKKEKVIPFFIPRKNKIIMQYHI
jgi:hypothetical protein